MKSYLVEIKNYDNDVIRYIDVVARGKSDARKICRVSNKSL